MRRAHPKGTGMPSPYTEYRTQRVTAVRLCPEDEGGCGGLLCSACCSLQTHPRDDYALPPPSRGESTPRATQRVRQCVNGCQGAMRTARLCQSCFGRRKAKEVRP